MRTIKLKLLTQNELVKVETDVRTFGEFKTEISNLGIDWSSAKLIDRASKVSFDVDSAILPAVDSIMFVMPTKSKAGASYQQELRAKIKQLKDDGMEIPFNYTHASNSQMEAFLASVEFEEEAENGVEIVDEITLTKPGKYILNVLPNVEVKLNYVDETTVEDLELEAEQLKAQL